MYLPILRDKDLLVRKIRFLLNFMYGFPVGDIISSMPLRVVFSPGIGVLKAVYSDDQLVAVRRKDGYLLLEKHGLNAISKAKLSRAVVVKDVAKLFVAKGRDVFAQHISGFVGQHYLGEDAIVVSEAGEVLGCGQLLLLPSEVKSFKRGTAIKIRLGAGTDPHEA